MSAFEFLPMNKTFIQIDIANQLKAEIALFEKLTFKEIKYEN